MKIITTLTDAKLIENSLKKDTSKFTTSDLKSLKVPQQILLPNIYKSNTFLVFFFIFSFYLKVL